MQIITFVTIYAVLSQMTFLSQNTRFSRHFWVCYQAPITFNDVWPHYHNTLHHWFAMVRKELSTLFCSKCFSDQCNAFPNCPTIASTQSINPTWIPKFYVSPNNFHKRGGEQTCTFNIHNFYRSTASDWTISLCQVSTFVIFPKPLQTVASGRRIWLQLVGEGTRIGTPELL